MAVAVNVDVVCGFPVSLADRFEMDMHSVHAQAVISPHPALVASKKLDLLNDRLVNLKDKSITRSQYLRAQVPKGRGQVFLRVVFVPLSYSFLLVQYV